MFRYSEALYTMACRAWPTVLTMLLAAAGVMAICAAEEDEQVDRRIIASTTTTTTTMAAVAKAAAAATGLDALCQDLRLIGSFLLGLACMRGAQVVRRVAQCFLGEEQLAERRKFEMYPFAM